ncbi:MAG: tRNA lysidine(34) synthetase TilS [bacterium]
MNTINALRTFFDNRISQGAPNLFFVAVSGGPDSALLLHRLAEFREEYSFDLIALHYNYHLHEHADKAEQLIRDRVEKYGVMLVSACLGRSQLLEQGNHGLEARARDLRYDWFDHIGELYESAGVFLGHHRRDQVETVLLNIGRGTGLYGLSGMEPVQKIQGGLNRFRPFLNCEKEQINREIKELEIPYVNDPTNQNTDFTRNWIRNELLPAWEQHQPDPTGALTQISRQARTENEFWEKHLIQKIAFDVLGGEIQVDVRNLREATPAERKRFLHFISRKYCGGPGSWDRVHIELLENLSLEQPSGNGIDLPEEYRAVKEYNWLSIFPRESISQSDRPVPVRELPFTSSDWTAGRLFIGQTRDQMGGMPLVSNLHYNQIEQLTLRTWNTGDRVETGQGTMSVKELFQEMRVPYRARRLWPMVILNCEVICVPGLVSTKVRSYESKTSIGFWPEHPAFHRLGLVKSKQ